MQANSVKQILHSASIEYPSSIIINGTHYIVIKTSTDIEEAFEDIAEDDMLFVVGEIIDEGNEEYYLSITEITLNDLLQADTITLAKEVSKITVGKVK